MSRRAPIPGLDFPIPLDADGKIIWPAPDPSSPYFIEGPALISFSGGRTSAFMLFQICWAHGGKLPANVHVCFANTGKEREETLRFVYEVGRWLGIHIYWLEVAERPKGLEGRRTPPGERFQEVGFNSASRNGEPLRIVIRRKQFLPNPAMRFCTIGTKIWVMRDFMKAQGYKHWKNAVGLRADEIRRIAKGQRRNDEGRDPFTTIWPMLKAGITSRDVWRFWLGGNADPKNLTEPLPQGFDLGLYPYEGNCDGCFLKGRDILIHQERERPRHLDWWAETEANYRGVTAKPEMAQFNKSFSYAELKRDAEAQPLLLTLDWRNLEFDAECGVSGTDARIRCGARRAA
jgi:3'-phosphoadenosine 5'-phosphosulfate sulfotransferase (PAPS reductase)/FAD synthetase